MDHNDKREIVSPKTAKEKSSEENFSTEAWQNTI